MSTLLLRLIAFLVGLLSWPTGQRIGAGLGLFWYHFLPIRRKTVLANLALALPDRSDHRAIARAAYRHFGMAFFELLKTATCTKAELSTRIHAHGLERFEKARARGKGVIVVTAHFGNFDLLAVSQAARGVPLAIVSRKLHSRGVNRFWMKTRKQSGLEIFPDYGAGKRIVKWLRNGNVLGLTIDQRTPPGRGGIDIAFMGHPAWTTTAPAALAIATGAALLPVRLERRPDGDHDLFVEEEIPAPRLRNAVTMRNTMEKCNEIIGLWAKNKPEQWMWLHKRFKHSKTD